jgi:hypothetical protein
MIVFQPVDRLQLLVPQESYFFAFKNELLPRRPRPVLSTPNFSTLAFATCLAT